MTNGRNDYKLTEIAADNPIYKQGNHWAEPSAERASLMRYCFDHRAQASELGALGREEVKEELSLKLAGQRMADALSLARAAQPFRAGALA